MGLNSSSPIKVVNGTSEELSYSYAFMEEQMYTLINGQRINPGEVKTFQKPDHGRVYFSVSTKDGPLKSATMKPYAFDHQRLEGQKMQFLEAPSQSEAGTFYDVTDLEAIRLTFQAWKK